MEEKQKGLWFQFWWRVTACHIMTYFIAGISAMTLLRYDEFFAKEIMSFMRPIDSPWVAAGVSLQIIRGILFALVLWPVKDVFLKTNKGWLKLWLLFIGLAILGTAGPAPGSIEGIIYTRIPFLDHVRGLPEVVIQTLLFSVMLFYWYKKPARTWNVLLGIGVALVVLMSVAGVFMGR